MEYPSRRTHAVRIKRRQLLRRLAGVLVAWALAGAAPAAAAVTVGQLAPTPPPPDALCSGDTDFLQPSVTGGELYTAKEAGEITSWSTNSSSVGDVYTFKVFRRTSDPDFFEVMSHAAAQTLPSGSGIRTFPAALQVQSGDMIGFNVNGGPGSCVFPVTGDSVLSRAGDLADGDTGSFTAQNDVRLNLSAVLVPSNGFTVSGLARNRRHGTAILTVTLSNPGTATLGGRGLRKRHLSKSLAVKGPVTFPVAPSGKVRRRLSRTGKAKVQVTIAFTPVDGAPNSQSLAVKLKKRRHPKAPGRA